MLAIETSIITRSFPLAKRIILELYNTSITFLEMKPKSYFLFQILCKSNILLSEIPKQYWNKDLRNLSVKLSFELVSLSLEYNEPNLVKRILYAASKMPNHKWSTEAKIEMVSEEILQPKDEKKKEAKKKNPKEEAKKKIEINNQENQQQLKQQKLVPNFIRDLVVQKSAQGYFEEMLLSISEENFDYVQNFIDNWKEQVEFFIPFVKNGNEVIDTIKQDLSAKFDFWDILREISTAFPKIQNIYKDSLLYFEFIAKFIRRILENSNSKKAIEFINQVNLNFNSNDPFNCLSELNKLKIASIKEDLEWFPENIQSYIEESKANKQNNEIAIEIFTQYYELEPKISEIFKNQFKEINYICLQKSDLYFLKATSLYMERIVYFTFYYVINILFFLF